jgi:NAD(P)-dependent dehydrogenase (short-subunit alcohol dehydrogenase family)
MGFRVIVHGRDADRVKKACAQVREAGGGSFASAIPALSDISTLEGCRTLADIVSTSCLVQNSPLDLIVNNAGIFLEGRSSRRETTQWSPEHILERTFAVNVAAPFVITSLLLPLLTAQDGARIVIVSSISQSSAVSDWQDVQFEKRAYSNHQAYSDSKLFDAMLCMEMAERLRVLGTDRVTVNCLDPGTVNTKMLLAGWGPCGIDVKDALDETWISTSSEMNGKTGLYFVGRRERKAAWPAYDRDQRTILWNILGNLAPDASEAWDFSTQPEFNIRTK